MKMLNKYKSWLFAPAKNISWKASAIDFARLHRLVYFKDINPEVSEAPLILGSTGFNDRVDGNYCIGRHAGYDIVLFDRVSTASHRDYDSVKKHWYVLQIDLKSTRVPYMFLGTKQQSKTYYAELLESHPGLHHLMLEGNAEKSASFHGNFVILAEPSRSDFVIRLFDERMVHAMGEHLYPFAVEVDNDCIIVTTEALKPNQQLMDKLLHYGIWFAKEIDRKTN